MHFKGFVYLTLNHFFLPSKLVTCTHSAELVKKGAVGQMDASPTCSVSLTLMVVPVPQAGRVCCAMKVRVDHSPDSVLVLTPRRPVCRKSQCRVHARTDRALTLTSRKQCAGNHGAGYTYARAVCKESSHQCL